MLLNRYGGAASARKKLAVVIALFLLFAAMPKNAAAYDSIDTDRETSLGITFSPTGGNAPSAVFKLYRAAEISDDLSFTLSEKFSKYPLSLTGLDSEGWRALAQTMAGYAAADNIEYDAAAETDTSGSLLFSSLKPALYLVTGAAVTVGSYTYTPSPFLVCLPSYQDDEWIYDVQTEVKYDTLYHGGGGGGGGGGGASTLTRKALKAWKNDDKSARPDSVSVTLLKNGSAYDTVTLSDDNNWRFTWSNLDINADWQLVENDVPSGYTVTVGKDGITFLVTNTYGGAEAQSSPAPADPSAGDTNTPSGGDDTSGGGDNSSSDGETTLPSGGATAPPNNNDGTVDIPSGGATPSPQYPNIPPLPNSPNYTTNGASQAGNNASSENGKLPQTGLLWWPVPLLAGAGTVIFAIGMAKRKKDGDDYES